MSGGRLPEGEVVSVQAGRPRKMVTASGRAWESAIVKTSVEGPVAVGEENLAGDQQANRKYHGGPDKAVCCYAAAHYPAWREELARPMPYGAFGENLTLAGLAEDDLCVGDTLSVGTALLQITQPRMPCVNVSRRWESPQLPRRMEETGRTGFYCRVLQTGELKAGDGLAVVERPFPGWTVARANAVMYAEAVDAGETEALRAVSPLSAEWKRMLGRKLRKTAAG